MASIDLNCDLGESFGVYRIGNDEEILPYISSANVACGFHAGDPAIMRKTVALCLQHRVAVGAHPGLADLIGFGRRRMAVAPQEAYELVVYQIGALNAFVRAAGGRLHHVKPHGALYNMAAADPALAEAIARAVRDVDPRLILYGLAGSELIEAGERLGLKCAREVFADRTYEKDGTLTPRGEPGANIDRPEQAVRQIMQILNEGQVSSRQGTLVPLRADTVCIHGDGPRALAIAKALHGHLRKSGIAVRAFDP